MHEARLGGGLRRVGHPHHVILLVGAIGITVLVVVIVAAAARAVLAIPLLLLFFVPAGTTAARMSLVVCPVLAWQTGNNG